MTKKLLIRAEKTLELLEKKYGKQFDTELTYKKEWHLLVAVVLSAKTTDANVNKATPGLFKKYKTPRALGKAPLKEIEELVYSTGYYKSKAQRIKDLGIALHKKHEGKVPSTMEELIALPGVGRKTANVILHVLHKKGEGIVMDTHVSRVTHRLGFTTKKDPKKGEEVMMKLLPQNKWKDWGDFLIQHGRDTCKAKKPLCNNCELKRICPSKNKV